MAGRDMIDPEYDTAEQEARDHLGFGVPVLVRGIKSLFSFLGSGNSSVSSPSAEENDSNPRLDL